MDNKFFWTPETQLYYEREKIISAKNNILIDSNNKEHRFEFWNMECFFGSWEKRISKCII